MLTKLIILSILTCPTTTTSAPAQNPKIEKILDNLEKAGEKITTLQAQVKHQLYQIIPDDRQTKMGLIRYRGASGKKSAKFMVYFDTLIHDELNLHRKEWFCFDGHWLREIREHTKTAIDREVVPPDEKVDPFKLGQGPFPLPFGQSKNEILKNFTVTLGKLKKQDPKNTNHLILKPLKSSRFYKKYKQLEFWVDKKINLPTKIKARDRHSNITTAWFTGIELNKSIKDDKLWVKVPKGFSYQKEPLPGG